jgi:uncharacterized glyoxalase superfamily metalloenzyme YdcJ
MTDREFRSTADLRTQFALSLAALYGSEVPAYNTLVEVTRQVNQDVLVARGQDAERLGNLDRVSAERHGAIRVGSPVELAQVAEIFAAFGMNPVGFYDLRDGEGTGVPVVSTAFRPVAAHELARNPFRVFTSLLAVDDRRFFDDDTRAQLTRFIQARQLFTPDLLALADRATREGGLPDPDATVLVRLATEAFRLSRAPINQAWHKHLSAISSVAADIGGAPSTHINHLTPRVLDIAELHSRMRARGIEMIDAIQGPPAWDGPDVLLRQTSFRALAEPRCFERADGSLVRGELRVRFGEVEQRGIALTAAGTIRYEAGMAAIAQLEPTAVDRAEQAADIWARIFPHSEAELAGQRLGWFTYVARPNAPTASTRLSELVATGAVTARPTVYEDFLPRSAAGIFGSNLTSRGARDDAVAGSDYDPDRLSGIIERPIDDPQDLYRTQRERSIAAAGQALGVAIDDDLEPAPRAHS